MILAGLVFVPLVGCVGLALLRQPVAVRVMAIAATLATLVLSGVVVAEYLRTSAELTYDLALSGPGSLVSLSADGIALPLVVLTALLSVVSVLVSWRAERLNAHLALLLGLEAAVMGVFLAADLVLFYVMWEAVLIPMFLLIGGWGHENRRRAAMKFFIYTFAGSALMLVGLIMLIAAQGTSDMHAPMVSLGGRETLIFWLLAAGFAVKVPVWPLHTWLPDAHVEAPTAGSVMLAGVLLKMGAYGFIRLCVPFAPGAFAEASPVLAVLGGIGIVYGAAVALGQTDLKRLVAYSSVSHMGFVLLGLASASTLGIQAAMLGMVSHGLVAGLLFLLVGALYDRTHTRELSAFGGLGREMPKWAAVFVFASLASLGLPGLSGFPGEFGAVIASFARFGWAIALVAPGVVLAGAYSLRAVRTVVHGEPGPASGAASRDLGRREVLAALPLVVLVVALGVWPRLVTELAAPAVTALVAAMGGGS